MSQSIVQVPVWSYVRARRLKLTAVGQVTVATFVAGGRDLELVALGTAVVKNAATALGLTARWTDPDGGNQTLAWFTYDTSKPALVGVYNLAAIPMVVAAGSTGTITAQAGTANNVVISTDVWGAEE